jgi:hypothetical protein
MSSSTSFFPRHLWDAGLPSLLPLCCLFAAWSLVCDPQILGSTKRLHVHLRSLIFLTVRSVGAASLAAEIVVKLVAAVLGPGPVLAVEVIKKATLVTELSDSTGGQQ